MPGSSAPWFLVALSLLSTHFRAPSLQLGSLAQAEAKSMCMSWEAREQQGFEDQEAQRLAWSLYNKKPGRAKSGALL